ncbi:unnamed protein product [marine sediment metagenome]|uniref:Uncharacterized protein n=1 Tax=marine sediment metagenome TaxID=412755 RepID=X0UZ90_9ZZZZ
MHFCANPKCLFHINVMDHVHLLSVPVPGPVRRLYDEEGPCAVIVTRERCLWMDNDRQRFFFCDVCNEAGKMVEALFMERELARAKMLLEKPVR